ncbi:hypothetical protein GCM10020220_027720 [Nonomuraea rubra]
MTWSPRASRPDVTPATARSAVCPIEDVCTSTDRDASNTTGGGAGTSVVTSKRDMRGS